MKMRDSVRFGQLFSTRVVFSVVVTLCLAFLVPLLTFAHSNSRCDLSLEGLTQTFWSPLKLSEESLASDRHFLLKDTRFSDAVMLDSRFGIFWHRVESLFTSGQIQVVQTLINDEPIYGSLFRLFSNRGQNCQKSDQLVINNLAGGETGYLSQQLYPDYDKPARFGSTLMTLLAGALLYLFLRWLI